MFVFGVIILSWRWVIRVMWWLWLCLGLLLAILDRRKGIRIRIWLTRICFVWSLWNLLCLLCFRRHVLIWVIWFLISTTNQIWSATTVYSQFGININHNLMPNHKISSSKCLCCQSMLMHFIYNLTLMHKLWNNLQ